MLGTEAGEAGAGESRETVPAGSAHHPEEGDPAWETDVLWTGGSNPPQSAWWALGANLL